MSVVRGGVNPDLSREGGANTFSQMNLHCLRSRREHPDCMPPTRMSLLAQRVGAHVESAEEVQAELNKIADHIVTYVPVDF